MEKLLSIIIPTYNMEKYLDRCLTSLILKDDGLMKQLEVIVVIDGAKDRSSEIAHKYENTHPETFRVIDKENGNYGSCINRGLKESCGIFLKILDADDYYETDGLAELLRNLKDCDADLCVTNYITIDDNEVMSGHIKVPKKYCEGIQKSENIKWGIDTDDLLFSMHAFCVRKKILTEHDYYQQEGISYTDTEFNYFCLLYSETISFMDIDVYKYLIGREGQTISPEASIKHADNYLKVARRLLDDYVSRTNSISLSRKNNIVIPIKKILSCFFNTELLAKNKEDINKAGVKELIEKCECSGIDIRSFDYHKLKYVYFYNKFGLSFNWINHLIGSIKGIRR